MMARMREMEQQMLRRQAEEKSGVGGAELESGPVGSKSAAL